MSTEIRRQLDSASRHPTTPIEPEALYARGLRRRWARRVAGGVGAASVLALAAVGIGWLTSPTPAPVIDEPSEASPTPDVSPKPVSSSSPEPSGPAADLGEQLLVIGPDPGTGSIQVQVLSPDGSERGFVLEANFTHYAAVFSDGAGGLVWQSGVQAPVLRTTTDGEALELLPASTSPHYYLRGVDPVAGMALVERATGDTIDTATAELIGVRLDGETPATTVRSSVGGWESGLIRVAARPDVLLSASAAEGFFGVGLHRTDREPVSLYSGSVSAEEDRYPDSVALTDSHGFILVEERLGPADLRQPRSRLLIVDPNGEPPSVIEEIDVPVELGLDGMLVAVGEVFATRQHVIVNRHELDYDQDGEDENWLQPLAYNVADNTWSVLDVQGRTIPGR